MSSYIVPSTAAERISDFNKLIDEFKLEYALLTEKQKKVSGHRARKALLSISKLTRFVRKDIQEAIAAISKSDKAAKAEKTTTEATA
jgi:hypothetical protein